MGFSLDFSLVIYTTEGKKRNNNNNNNTKFIKRRIMPLVGYRGAGGTGK